MEIQYQENTYHLIDTTLPNTFDIISENTQSALSWYQYTPVTRGAGSTGKVAAQLHFVVESLSMRFLEIRYQNRNRCLNHRRNLFKGGTTQFIYDGFRLLCLQVYKWTWPAFRDDPGWLFRPSEGPTSTSRWVTESVFVIIIALCCVRRPLPFTMSRFDPNPAPRFTSSSGRKLLMGSCCCLANETTWPETLLRYSFTRDSSSSGKWADLQVEDGVNDGLCGCMRLKCCCWWCGHGK